MCTICITKVSLTKKPLRYQNILWFVLIMIKEIKIENCIVGSGFCGYAAYTKMIRERKDLLLIEGGNLQTPKNQEEQNTIK